jgi:saccharopine dehydrogenase-like NADP-dependent oxidoreductase
MSKKQVVAIVGGLGKIGTSIAGELKNAFEKFVFIDSKEATSHQIDFFNKTLKNNQHIIETADTGDTKYLAELLKKHEASVCIGTVPSIMQDKVAGAAAIYGQCHYFDLGASEECLKNQKKLDEKFKKSGKILMPFCGFDPGMLNILLLSCAQHISCDTVRVCVGGIAETKPANSFVHEWTFNPESTLETYCGNVYAIQNGDLVTHQALGGYIQTYIKNKPYEAFFTNCGNKEVLEIIKKQFPAIKKCEIRTVRHCGHRDIARFLVKAGFLGNEAFPTTSKQLAKTIPFAEKDITLLEMRFYKKGNKVVHMEWQEHGARKTNSAMQKATAKSATLIIELALEYASHTPISGFVMPEIFTSTMLKMTPKDLIKKMKDKGLSVTSSFP